MYLLFDKGVNGISVPGSMSFLFFFLVLLISPFVVEGRSGVDQRGQVKVVYLQKLSLLSVDTLAMLAN